MVDDFDSWYAELRPTMAPALAAWCGDPSLAAEALDEAFARAFERWERVRNAGSPSGWVWRTATNVARRRLRRAAMERRILSGQRSIPVTVPAYEGEDVDLRRALMTLTERQRTAVVLHHIADLSNRDVADILGVAIGTVGATLHQARSLLAEHLSVPPEDSPGVDGSVAIEPNPDGGIP